MNTTMNVSAKAGISTRSTRSTQPAQRCNVCQAAADDIKSTDSVKTPEWVPEQVTPSIDFLAAQDFDLKQWGPYKQYLQKYTESEIFNECTGWKTIPESINGRLAMLGFLTGGLAEILGAGPVLKQVAFSPQPVLITILLLITASVVPVYKGVKGDYLESLRETYSIPEGWFTPVNERVHARLAMVGMFGLLLSEVIKGTPVL